MPTYFQRPENALKRANEFIDVGKKQRALDALYDVIKSKKHRTWQKIHEPIMEKYLELCVELKKSHIAKEGLYQYKNICQQVNIKSLEDVVRNYLKLAEEKTEAAREESQQAVVDIDDLDNLLTPESLLLSAVSGEDTQDRTDRVVLTPWVKFLWESYRQCLELLRNNSRVEALYHDIARQAFKFCLKYTRKTEFRKLCESLRTHLGHIHKHQNQQTAINLNNPESQAMHLETRLVQLDSAINMELWQEAYKAIEDIHLLMTLSKKPPKPQLMANYYQKLALVFWKAGNYLFHASALHRLFHLSRELKKNLTQDEVQRMASKVLLATLAIPIPPSRNEIDKYLELDDTTVEKQRRLATLLSLPTPPTRTTLIKDLVKYSVVQFVIPELQNIYHWLEVEFHPLQLCSQVSKCFEFISESKDSDIHQYMPALQDITIMRLLKQVSQVYQTIEFSRLATLAPFASLFRLERLIVDAARTCDLQVRIDHRTKTLSFGTDLGVGQREDVPEGPYLQSMPSEQIRNQLIQMSCALHKTVDLIQPAKRKVEQEDRRLQIISSYRASAKKEHQRILTRRQIIEDRKEMLENLSVQREQEEQKLLEDQKRKVFEAEMLRLEREAEERERLRRQEEHEKIQKMQVQERIDQLIKSGLGPKIFKDLAEEELKSLNAEEIMAKQVEQLDREKKELTAKLKAQEKKIDYFARAVRLEELPPLQNQYEEQAIKDKEFWEQQEEERIKTAIQDRQQALEMRNRLRHMQVDKDKFYDQLTASRMSLYKDKLAAFEKVLEEERQKRLLDRKIQRKLERRITRKREKEEEEKRKKEEETKKEIARKKAEEDAAYKAKMAKLEEIAAKQRAREREIEERAARQAEENRQREKDKDIHDRSAPWKPSGEGRGGWREREKDRERSWRTPVKDDLSSSPPPGKSDREADRDHHDDDWRNHAPSLNEDSDKKLDDKGPPPRRDEDRRLKDDIRRDPLDDIRRGTSDDIRRPIDDIRRTVEDIRRPVEEVRRPVEEVRRPVEEVRRPVEDVRRPMDDIRRSITDDIRRSTTDDIRRSTTEDIRRGPTDDRRSPLDDIRRGPLDDIRRGPLDDRRGSPDGIRRGLSDDIRRGTPDDIRRGPPDDRDRRPLDEFRRGPAEDIRRGPTEDRIWRRDDRNAPQRDDRIWRRDDQRSTTARSNDDSEWRRDDRIQSSRDDRGLSSREDRVISSRDVMDKDRRTPLRRDDNWRTGDREQSSRTDTKKWRREDFSQDDKGRYDDRGPPSRDWSFKERGMDDDNRVWRKDDRIPVRRNDDSDWRGGFKERVGALREKEDKILPREREDKGPTKERERLPLKKVDNDVSPREERGSNVRKNEGRRIEAEDEDGWQTVRH